MSGITFDAINPALGQTSVTPGKNVQGSGFSEILRDSLEAVSGQQQEAKVLTEGLLSGQHSNIHETMIAMEKSSISFKLLTKVQIKVLEAYQEVMRLQL